MLKEIIFQWRRQDRWDKGKKEGTHKTLPGTCAVSVLVGGGLLSHMGLAGGKADALRNGP